MVRLKILLILFVSFFTISSFAQNITALATTDTTDYYIGDIVTYKLQIEYNKNIKIENPDLLKNLSNIDVLGSKGPLTKVSDNKKITTYLVTLSRYDSAEVTIPPITIDYRVGKDTLLKHAPVLSQNSNLIPDSTLKHVTSNPVSFVIHLMKVNTKEDIKDVKTPITIPLDWKIIGLFILIGLIIIALIIYFYRRYKKKKAGIVVERKIIVQPPHVTALASLNKLEEKQLWQKGMVKEYHSEITEIIRKYFEDRFKLPALELTTTEAIDALKKRKEADIILDITNSFLNNADLVKFAKFKPLVEINEEMMIQAREIVNKTAKEAVAEIKKEEVNV